MDIELLISNLSARNIQAQYVKNLAEAKAALLAMLPANVSVGIGNSRTLKDMNLTETLIQKGYRVYDKTLAESKAEGRSMKKQALLADWYISGSNAISIDGRIVNIDHSGNRVAALAYGPEHVVIVVGINKLSANIDEALQRARFQAAPQNARRAGLNPPCALTDECIDCRHPERVCYNVLITEGQGDPQRMTVMIVGEEAGF